MYAKVLCIYVCVCTVYVLCMYVCENVNESESGDWKGKSDNRLKQIPKFDWYESLNHIFFSLLPIFPEQPKQLGAVQLPGPCVLLSWYILFSFHFFTVMPSAMKTEQKKWKMK